MMMLIIGFGRPNFVTSSNWIRSKYRNTANKLSRKSGRDDRFFCADRFWYCCCNNPLIETQCFILALFVIEIYWTALMWILLELFVMFGSLWVSGFCVTGFNVSLYSGVYWWLCVSVFQTLVRMALNCQCLINYPATGGCSISNVVATIASICCSCFISIRCR